MSSKLVFLPSAMAYAFSSALQLVSYSRDEPVFDVGSNGFAEVRPITYIHRHTDANLFLWCTINLYKVISAQGMCATRCNVWVTPDTDQKYVWFWMQCECHSPGKLRTKWSNLYDHPIWHLNNSIQHVTHHNAVTQSCSNSFIELE